MAEQEAAPMQPTPPVAAKKSYATLGVRYGQQHHTIRYARTTTAVLLEKTVRNICGVSFGAAIRLVDPKTSSANYILDPKRLPDGKQLHLELHGPPRRIKLSAKSSALWFPTLSGLHSARSSSSLPVAVSGSIGDTAPLTDRTHYRGSLALRMSSVPMPMPPADAPLSARSFSSTAPDGQYKICVLGDSGVGKTSFTARMSMTDNPREYRWDDQADHKPTTAVAISTATVTTSNGPIQVKLWEISGKCTTSTSSRRKAKNAGDAAVYLAGADAAIVFFSFKQPPAAYRNVLRWTNLVRRTCGAIPLLVVGLGADDKRSVAARAEVQAPHPGILPASNKSGANIYTPMVTLLAQLEKDSELRLQAHRKLVPVTPATDFELVRHVSESWQSEDPPTDSADAEAGEE